LSQAASMMVHRSTVTRPHAGKDGYGHESRGGAWEVVEADAPCLLYVGTVKLDAEGKHADVKEVRALFRNTSMVQKGDRISELRNRRGDDLATGFFDVETVTPRVVGGMFSHLELTLRRTT